MRIYTRSGDSGETGLFGGQRVSKIDPRVEAFGTVDELNAVLGVARAHAADSEVSSLVARIQNQLFSLGADLSTPYESGESHGRITIERIPEPWTDELEWEINRLESEVAPLTQFILPGGTTPAAHLHFARAVCRRAERRCVALARTAKINGEVVRYLNRLSDLLFVMARVANTRADVLDVPWEKPS